MDLSHFASIVKAFFDALTNFLGVVEFLFMSPGRFPPPGDYTPKVWAWYLKIDVESFRRQIKRHNVPFRKPGAEMFISVDDFRKHIPYHNVEDEKE